jgi:hypothetical protein
MPLIGNRAFLQYLFPILLALVKAMEILSAGKSNTTTG